VCGSQFKKHWRHIHGNIRIFKNNKGGFTLKTGTIISNGIIIVLLLASTSAGAQILPEDPSRGGQLFVSKGCVKCHAVKGEGGKTGPDLGTISLGNTQLDLAAEIWNHTPSMIAGMEQAGIAKSTLTGQEFTEITAYLYFLRFFDESGDAASGEYLFDQKGCISCHLVSGRGKDGEPGLDEFPRNASPVFLSQSIWNHSLRMMARMVRIGMMWPHFTETEMMDTLAYIRTKAKGADEPFFFKPGNPREGRAVFNAKGCANCHSVHGEGATKGIDLGKRAETFYTSLTQIASSMWNKSPEMILFTIAPTQCGVPRFTAKEMTDLLAYLYFLHYTDEPGDASKGKIIFSTIGCAQCHGLDGKRGKLMFIDLSKFRNSQPTEIVASIWNHSINMREATGKKGVPWPQLKGGEMADLLEYIRTPVKK
jgi:mono/diheme cytochrome c family protein